MTNTLDLRLRVTTWTNHCVYNAKLQSDKHKPFITNAVKDIIPSSHLSDIPPEPPSCVMTVMYFKSCHWSMLTTFAVLVSRWVAQVCGKLGNYSTLSTWVSEFTYIQHIQSNDETVAKLTSPDSQTTGLRSMLKRFIHSSSQPSESLNWVFLNLTAISLLFHWVEFLRDECFWRLKRLIHFRKC